MRVARRLRSQIFSLGRRSARHLDADSRVGYEQSKSHRLARERQTCWLANSHTPTNCVFRHVQRLVASSLWHSGARAAVRSATRHQSPSATLSRKCESRPRSAIAYISGQQHREQLSKIAKPHACAIFSTLHFAFDCLLV